MLLHNDLQCFRWPVVRPQTDVRQVATIGATLPIVMVLAFGRREGTPFLRKVGPHRYTSFSREPDHGKHTSRV